MGTPACFQPLRLHNISSFSRILCTKSTSCASGQRYCTASSGCFAIGASPYNVQEAQLTGSLPCLHPIEPSNSTCDELMPPICEGATSLRVAEQLHGEWVLHAADPTYVLNWKCEVKPYEVDQHEFICHSEGWFGECERETRAVLSVDAWGGYRLTSASPIHVPSELMSSGNLSVTDDRLILLRDGDLVGRRYSVWVRPNYEPGNELADELSRFCIWPLPAQTCTRVSNC